MNAISATPLIRLPSIGLVWLEGRLSTTVVRVPSEPILEMREPVLLPVYGPTSGITCVQLPAVELVPPTPPSATYNEPSGPNFSPRGLFRPVAKTETLEDGVGSWGGACASARELPNGPSSASTSVTAHAVSEKRLPASDLAATVLRGQLRPACW